MLFRKDSFILLLVLFIGLTLSIIVFNSSRRTSLSPKAEFPNINTASEIASTLNADGTMGPGTWSGNFSNKLKESQKGRLSLYITDPWPSWGGRPVLLEGTPTPWFKPTSTRGNEPTPTPTVSQEEGFQTVTSLILYFEKVEVYLSNLWTRPPSEEEGNNTNAPREGLWQPTGMITPPGGSRGYWETLNFVGHRAIDLVQLAQKGDSRLLATTTLAAGQYNEIRLYISGGTATLENGRTVELAILGRDKIVRVVEPFTIVAGQTTKLTVDFDAQHSVIKVGDNYLLRPVVSRIILGD